MTDLELAQKLQTLSNSAKSRNIEFNLSFKQVKKLMGTKKCYYTGVFLNDKVDDVNQRTIDRIDNDKGYTDDNTVACCLSINRRKGNMSLLEIKILYLKTKHKM